MSDNIAKEPSLALDSYASLRDDVVLHVFPNSGTIMSKEKLFKPIFTSTTTINILSKCNGKKTCNEIISEYVHSLDFQDDFEICKSLLDIATLIADQMVVLNKTSKENEVKLTGDLSIFYPTNLQIELTTDCNLKCSYCYRNAGEIKKNNQLKTDKLFKILDSLHNVGLQSIELTGGEPTLHPDFIEIMNFCAKKFAIIGLLTNGTLITEELALKMLDFKEKMVISISLDAHTSEIHDQRRGVKGSFEKTCKNIRLLAKYGFLTRVTMTFDEDTWDYIEPTLLLSKKLGASMFAYSPVLPVGRAKMGFKYWAYDAMKVQETEKVLREKYKDYIHLLSDDIMAKLDNPGSCGAGYRCFCMDPTGKIRPCVTFNEGSAILGSLIESSPEEVFANPLAKYFANIKAPNEEICQSCEWSFFCINCNLRGLMMSESVDNCKWINQPDIKKWKDLIYKYSLPEYSKKELILEV